MAQGKLMSVESRRVYPTHKNGYTRISVPDELSDSGYSNLFVKNEDVTKSGTMYVVSINPEAMYKISRRVKDAQGNADYEDCQMTGSEIMAYNDKAMERASEAKTQPYSADVIHDSRVFEETAQPQYREKGKAKTAAAGMAAGAAAAKAVQKSTQKATKDAAETKSKKSFADKAKTVGKVATGAAVLAPAALAAEGQHILRKSYVTPIAESIGQLLMAPVGPVERRMPAIGTDPKALDRRDGTEFDIG